MEDRQFDAIVISKPENIYYACGFAGGEDGLLVIDSSSHYVLTDSRYFEQLKSECPDAELWENDARDLGQSLQARMRKYGRIALETHYISHDFYQSLNASLDGRLVSAGQLVESIRIVKDVDELELLRASGRAGDLALEDTISGLKIAATEIETAARLKYHLQRHGCTGESFDSIVLFGANSALPHGQPGADQLGIGQAVLFDFGGFYKHYTADMSRTFFCGSREYRFDECYKAVLEAQETGISLIRSGITAGRLHEQVKAVLARYDLDRFFIHGTGHGIGLEIHESPRIGQNSDSILESNMVVTVEPGIYIPGWGGIRIEDSVIVKDNGCEIITCSQKDLKYLAEG